MYYRYNAIFKTVTIIVRYLLYILYFSILGIRPLTKVWLEWVGRPPCQRWRHFILTYFYYYQILLIKALLQLYPLYIYTSFILYIDFVRCVNIDISAIFNRLKTSYFVTLVVSIKHAEYCEWKLSAGPLGRPRWYQTLFILLAATSQHPLLLAFSFLLAYNKKHFALLAHAQLPFTPFGGAVRPDLQLFRF